MSDDIKVKLNLLTLLEAVEKIELYSKDFKSADDFFRDSKSFDASMMQFIVIGEVIDKLDSAYKTLHSDIPWQEIKDFRNVIAHDYFGLSAYDIWEIIQDHLLPLRYDLQVLVEQL
ncbi:MAG: HepT-like ribonuclease domain-containing protein [Campylobacterota bacterium]|nr:HepT-like ribonuclease domain-containing protein [Campylobacterota bacterium]